MLIARSVVAPHLFADTAVLCHIDSCQGCQERNNQSPNDYPIQEVTAHFFFFFWGGAIMTVLLFFFLSPLRYLFTRTDLGILHPKPAAGCT
jgi:hypothetical protein